MSGTREILEHRDQLVASITLLTSQFDEFFELRRQEALIGLGGHPDASTATHLHETFVTQNPKCAQHRVGIDAQLVGEVPSLRDLLTGASLTLGDGSANLRRHLLVEQSRVATVEGSETEVRLRIFCGSVDKTHNANYSGFMASLLDVPQVSGFEKSPWDPTIEVLFREARRRERRRRIRSTMTVLAGLAVTFAAMGFGVNSAGSSAVKPNATPPVVVGSSATVLTCSGAAVVRPRTLIVACADANTSLQSTHWSTWGSAGASGTTTFAMNLCTPYCAASPLSHFPHSSVTLSAPISSRHGTYFSSLVVRYRQGSTWKTFTFAWPAGVTR